MWGIKTALKKQVKATLRSAGFDVVRHRPDGGVPDDHVLVPRYLCPSGHKLYDFRAEPGFSEIAGTVIADARTLLDYNRLFVLWQATRNTRRLKQTVAEVGTYRGGSAKFLALALRHWGGSPPLHAFDTFEGHPDVLVPSLDGPHTAGLFSDTDYAAVRAYLSDFPNVELHQGAFQETCGAVAGETFSLVHVDVDIYESTVACLDFFWPRLCEDGVIVIDDYGFTTCRGLKQVVDRFVEGVPECRAWYMHTGQCVLHKGR